VLNLLHGLSPRFDRVTPILTSMKSFPTFAEVKNDLLLEELCLSATTTTAPATALYSVPRAAPSDSGGVTPGFQGSKTRARNNQQVC
jgi:hypothetical protein